MKKSYFAVFGQQDSKNPKKPCSGAEWPTRLNSLSFWERIISPHLARKTTKTLKSRVQKLNAPFGLIRPVCPEDSDNQKQPSSGAKWPIRLVWPSLWERGNSPHLVRKTTKSPKSRVPVSEWPIRLDSPSLWERLFRRIWRARLRKDQKAMFKCKMPPSTWFVQFVRKNYYAVFGQQDSKKPKKPKKAVIRWRMAHSTWFAQFVRKLFCCIWPSGPEWPIGLDLRSLWQRIILL